MLKIDTLKQALASFPSGVVIATTLDSEGRPHGFTATAFSSVSIEPPLVLLCLARTAQCHEVFSGAQYVAINLLAADGKALAERFSTVGARKFEVPELIKGPHGLVLVQDAIASLVCIKRQTLTCGDHTILINEVETISNGPSREALIYYRRRYWLHDTSSDSFRRALQQ
jgi:flavin reductase ActVB